MSSQKKQQVVEMERLHGLGCIKAKLSWQSSLVSEETLDKQNQGSFKFSKREKSKESRISILGERI